VPNERVLLATAFKAGLKGVPSAIFRPWRLAA